MCQHYRHDDLVYGPWLRKVHLTYIYTKSQVTPNNYGDAHSPAASQKT